VRYSSLPERYTRLNGYNIRYLDYDAETHRTDDYKTLVLLHGIGASAERWLPVAPSLSNYFRVIVVDIIGFGYSDRPKSRYTTDFFISFLQEFLENLHIDNKPSIIASSFSGRLATEFAIRFSNTIEKLVLAAPAGTKSLFTPAFLHYIFAAHTHAYEDALTAFRNMVYDPRIVTADLIKDFMNRMYLPHAIDVLDSTLKELSRSPQLHGRLSKIRNPTLLIWGENDPIIPKEEHASEYLEIPDNHVELIPQCGHTPFVEKPLEFTEIVLKFLSKEEELFSGDYKHKEKYKNWHQCRECGSLFECPPDRCQYNTTKFRIEQCVRCKAF
jgi:2-hydroxy-6-oxonona-2,4-dienedioate hydrolase